MLAVAAGERTGKPILMLEDQKVALPVFDTHVLEIVLLKESAVNDPTPLTEEQITQDILEYREFLRTRKLNPDQNIVPPVHVDRVWHLHMVQTRQYREDCIAYFGYILDHASMMCHGGGDELQPWHTRPAT